MIEPGLYKHHSPKGFLIEVLHEAYLVKRPNQTINKQKYKYVGDVLLHFNGVMAELYEARNKNNPQKYLIDCLHNYQEIPYYCFTEPCVVYKVPDNLELGLLARSYTNFTSTSITGKPMFTKVIKEETVKEYANT